MDRDDNLTRFVVVGRSPVELDPRITCKTSLILAMRHEEGALVKVLQTLADRGLNLTKLESRPRPGSPWKYVFYLDTEGRLSESEMTVTVAELEPLTQDLKLLGTDPARTVADARPAEPARPRAGGVSGPSLAMPAQRCATRAT